MNYSAVIQYTTYGLYRFRAKLSMFENYNGESISTVNQTENTQYLAIYKNLVNFSEEAIKVMRAHGDEKDLMSLYTLPENEKFKTRLLDIFTTKPEKIRDKYFTTYPDFTEFFPDENL